VSDGQSGPPVQPELRWVKVTGPDALRPLDRHWVRYVRLALLLAAVLIAWRILAWQEDGYRAAASAAGEAVLRGTLVGAELPSQTSPAITQAAQSGVEIVVLSPTPTATPTPVPTPTPTPAPTPATHTVRAGETLSGISQLYNVPVDVIVALNDIPDPDNLLVGQRLRLPEGTEVEIHAPVFKIYGEDYDYLFDDIRTKGCRHVRIDGIEHDISEEIELDPDQEYDIQVIVDKFFIKKDIDKQVLASL